MKVNFIKKDGNKLLVYIKKSYFKTPLQIQTELEKFEDNYVSYLGWEYDVTCKYIIATFVLRNIEDIKPYIESVKVKMCNYCVENKRSITGKSVKDYEFKKTKGYIEPKNYRDYLELFILKGESDKKAGLMIDSGNGCRFVDIDYCPFCGRKLNVKFEEKIK